MGIVSAVPFQFSDLNLFLNGIRCAPQILKVRTRAMLVGDDGHKISKGVDSPPCLQMIAKPSLAKSNGIEFGKKWSSLSSRCKGVLALGYPRF